MCKYLLLLCFSITVIFVKGQTDSLSKEDKRLLDSMFKNDEFIKLMTTLLEPVMILAVGGVIGLIVIAMLLPIFQLDVFAR